MKLWECLLLHHDFCSYKKLLLVGNEGYAAMTQVHVVQRRQCLIQLFVRLQVCEQYIHSALAVTISAG